jgi:hypothetical protein
LRIDGTLEAVTVSAVLELVARMRRDSFSRNRNFDAFASASDEATRARRLWRYLRSIERDLTSFQPRPGMSGVNLRVERRTDGGRRITIDVPEVRVRRIAVLSAEEYALLCEHPDARAILERFDGAEVG